MEPESLDIWELVNGSLELDEGASLEEEMEPAVEPLDDPFEKDVSTADKATPDPSGGPLAASSTPWANSLDHLGDFDRDNIPNYADRWFGPGPTGPFGASAAEHSVGADTEIKPSPDVDEPAAAELEPPDPSPSDAEAISSLAAEEILDSPAAEEPLTENSQAVEELQAEKAEPAEEPQNEKSDLASPDEQDQGLGAEAVATFGEPEAASKYWHQQEGSNSCAVVCQQSILECVAGIQVSESELCQTAETNGWYHPDKGTFPEDMTKLLEHYGVQTETRHGMSPLELVETVNSGNNVMVGLDANEIWHPATGADGLPLEQPDMGHAVWVTGAHFNSDGGMDVVLNDPGHANGAGKAVAMSDFLNAWQDTGRKAVVIPPTMEA